MTAQYRISWGPSYEPCTPRNVDADFFSEANGFDEPDRTTVVALEVGQSTDLGCDLDIRRLS